MKRAIIIPVFLFCAQCLPGQALSKANLDKQFKNGTLYVVDGVPYEQKDSVLLDSVLHSYPEGDLVEIIILKQEGTIRCRNEDVVLICFAHQQTKREIREQFKGIKALFRKGVKEPALSIEGELVADFEVRECVKKLKIDDIYYIHSQDGLVRVWLKNRRI